MPKFIITQTDRYVIEANTIEEAQEDYKRNLVDGSLADYDFLDGSTTYEEIICFCSKHACKNIDDYVAQGAYCENCFMDCVKVDN
jgi:hypothetical protein